jgi:hypothetical protein
LSLKDAGVPFLFDRVKKLNFPIKPPGLARALSRLPFSTAAEQPALRGGPLSPLPIDIGQCAWSLFEKSPYGKGKAAEELYHKALGIAEEQGRASALQRHAAEPALGSYDGNAARGEQTGLRAAPIFNGYPIRILG